MSEEREERSHPLTISSYYIHFCCLFFFFFSSRRRHTRSLCDWSSDVCSSDLVHFPSRLGAARVSPRRAGSRAGEDDPAGLCHRVRLLSPHAEIGRASCRERV